MVRRLVVSLLLVAFIGGTALGWSATGGGQVDVAYAACGVFTNCGTDLSVMSALEVNHIEGPSAGGDPVEPDNGESWEIEAVWAGVYSSLCACTEVSSSVTADVTWTGLVGLVHRVQPYEWPDSGRRHLQRRRVQR